jgi:hypothetical protein
MAKTEKRRKGLFWDEPETRGCGSHTGCSLLPGSERMPAGEFIWSAFFTVPVFLIEGARTRISGASVGDRSPWRRTAGPSAVFRAKGDLNPLQMNKKVECRVL